MECSNAAEIKAKLLSPPARVLLQKYIDRLETDPDFLYFHESSTVLDLRLELGLRSASGCLCAECAHNTVLKCLVVEVLKQAIEESKAERDSKVA